MIQRFKEMPAGERPMPKEEGERIMHISLPIGEGTVLMASDISPGSGHVLTVGNNNYISLQPDSLDEARRLFAELPVGGKVEMPLEKMFWGAYFASFADQFGVRWMINFDEKAR